MTTEEFLNTLRTTGEYSTPAAWKPRVHDRLLGHFSAWYHARIFAVVCGAAAAAWRGAYTPRRWAEDAHRMLRAAEACGARCRISGFLPTARTPGPKVFISNHMSSLETYVLPGVALSIGDVATVVKSSLLTYPLFGAVMRAVKPIAVGRRNPRDDLHQVLVQGCQCLEAGRSVVLFPQATRRREFVPEKFNSLGVKLAARAGVPVVAVALKTDFHGIGRWVKDLGRVDRRQPVLLQFSEPMAVDARPKETHRVVVGFISSHLRDWGIPIMEGDSA